MVKKHLNVNDLSVVSCWKMTTQKKKSNFSAIISAALNILVAHFCTWVVIKAFKCQITSNYAVSDDHYVFFFMSNYLNTLKFAIVHIHIYVFFFFIVIYEIDIEGCVLTKIYRIHCLYVCTCYLVKIKNLLFFRCHQRLKNTKWCQMTSIYSQF